MTAFAGRLIPVDKVEVAIMTNKTPFLNAFSSSSHSSPVSPE